MFEIEAQVWADKEFNELPGEVAADLRTAIHQRLRSDAVHLGILVLSPADLVSYVAWLDVPGRTWADCVALWEVREPDRAELLHDRMDILLDDLTAWHDDLDPTVPAALPVRPFPRSMAARELLVFAEDLLAISAGSVVADQPGVDVPTWLADPIATVKGWNPEAVGTDIVRRSMKCDFAALMDDALWNTAPIGLKLDVEIARRLGDHDRLRRALAASAPELMARAGEIMTRVTLFFIDACERNTERFAKLPDLADAVWAEDDLIRACRISDALVSDPFAQFDPRADPKMTINGAALLASVGLDVLPDDAKADLLHELQGQLEMRVGQRLGDAVTADQLTAFETLIDAGEEQLAAAWLAVNVPTYRDQTLEEHRKLVAELRAAAPGIRASLLPTSAAD